MQQTEHTPVLVVGGGLVGLSAALFLRYHGVSFVLVERRDRPSVLPRSRGVHVRTVEMFRQIGIEGRVQEAGASALKMGTFGGARRGATMTGSEPILVGGPNSSRGHRVMGAAEASPSTFCFCPQVILEPVLAEVVRDRGGDLRPGMELTRIAQDANGVSATVRNLATGQESLIEADYLIAADGAGSPVREALGIGGWTLPPTHHYVNVFVRADLTAQVEGRTFSQCEFANDTVRGLILSKNNTDEWSFHLEYDPDRESLADYPEQRCADLVRAAVGVPDLDVTVLARTTWDTGVHVAEEYRRGRIFLAGDAAHRHAPWGGFGANTGVADVHNLTWKLAGVLAGHAGPSLLDTYQAERRPRAVLASTQARIRTDFLARFGIQTPENAESMENQIDMGTVINQYRYVSQAVMPERADDEVNGDGAGRGWVTRLAGQPGTRIPHMWLDRAGRHVSTLDLCGPGFTLLASADADRWQAAAAEARAATALDVAVHDIGTADAEAYGARADGAGIPGAGAAGTVANWLDRVSLPAGGALLVRPDQHVAARSDQGLTPDLLPGIVSSLIGITAGVPAAQG